MVLTLSVQVVLVVLVISTANGDPKYQDKGHKPGNHDYDAVPTCAKKTNENFCLEDNEYPDYEVKKAIEEHFAKFDQLYADVLDQGTIDSVDGLKTIKEETYLCPSDTIYGRPLRAINSEGKWRIIVNYEDNYSKYTQTIRIEQCRPQFEGGPCPKIPACYETRCLQKSVYHRMIAYDPNEYKFPFFIESFKLPASCACYQGGFESY
ncbi:neurotrophin 1-like [Artemia franciscana]|uniref:neurotrophin 1-like n=1 Tax=Artemia franciscana TaxID=6661 RepID=UPI0032DB06A5